MSFRNTAFALVTLAALVRVAPAQTDWTGAASSNLWGTAGNWSAGVPVAGSPATFNGAGNGFTAIDLGGTPRPVGSIVFDTAAAAAYTFSGNAGDAFLFDAAGAITVNAGVTTAQSFATPLQLLGGFTVTNNGSAALTLNGGVSLGTGGTAAGLTFAGTGNTTLAGGIAAGAATTLTKSGAGTLTLTAANDYAGNTTVSGGALNVQNGNALGTAASTVSVAGGAALQLQGGIAVPAAKSLTLVGEGPATTGALRNVSGTNAWAGNITIGAAAITRIGTDAGSLTIAGNVALSPTATDQFVIQGNGTGEISGVISGVSRVTRSSNGTGTWTLSGANTYTGRTVVTNGTLSVASINSVVGGTASSNLGAPTTVANGTIDLGGTTNTGVLRYTGPGEVTDRVINLAGSSGGGTVTNNGTGPLTFTSNLTAAAGTKTLTLNGSGTGTFAGNIVNGSGTVNVAKGGTGTWALSGANTYSGTTTVATGGVLRVDSPTALGSTAAGTTVNSGGALQIQDTGITVTGEALTLTGDGVSAATGSFRSLGGATAWTGTVTVNAAATTRVTSDAGTFTLSGNVALSPTATDQFVLQGNGNGVISGVVSGAGRLTKGVNGTGTWSLTGDNTYTGTTLVSAGGLLVNNATGSGTGTNTVTVGTGGRLGGGAATAAGVFTGTTGFIAGGVTVNSGGAVAPGNSVGTLTVGSAAFASGSALNVELGSTVVRPSPDADVNVNDRLNVLGALTFGTALTVNVDGGGLTFPTPFQPYDYFIAQSPTPVTLPGAVTFNATNFATPGTFALNLNAAGTGVYLTFTPVPEPASVTALALGALAAVERLRRRRCR